MSPYSRENLKMERFFQIFLKITEMFIEIVDQGTWDGLFKIIAVITGYSSLCEKSPVFNNPV